MFSFLSQRKAADEAAKRNQRLAEIRNQGGLSQDAQIGSLKKQVERVKCTLTYRVDLVNGKSVTAFLEGRVQPVYYHPIKYFEDAKTVCEDQYNSLRNDLRNGFITVNDVTYPACQVLSLTKVKVEETVEDE